MNERTVFLAALDITDPAERSIYLDRACAGNSKLRQQVDALLMANDRSGEFLNVPALRQMVDNPDVTQTSEMKNESKFDLACLTPSTKPGSLGTLGHYEVMRVLGQGGFGTVLKAFDEKLHRMVAIKVLSRQLAATSPPRKRFIREARAVAAIKHENVVQVYSVEEQPLPYIVMELVDGSTLQDKMDEAGPIDIPEVLHIGRQIAAGLAAAHALGLIHRDIKPGNILLEKGVVQKVKITDFGLARTADDASLTQSGTITGTPLYMAPEQAKGEKLDQRADLFSLGSVLYQMASGRAPFRANNMVAVLKRVAEDTPRPIREIIPETPQWLCDIIAKLHAKNPDDRYQSAREVVDVLADCEAQLKTNSKLKDFSRIPVRVAKPPRKANLKLAFASIAFSFLVLAIWAAPFTIRYAQNHGEIEFNGNVDFEVKKLLVRENGVVIATLDRANPRLKLPPGVYELEAASVDGYEASKFQVNTVRLLSGGGSYEHVDGRPVIKLTVNRGDSTSIIAIAEKRSERPAKPLVAAFKNSIGMEFALVPKGKSWLGGGGGKPGDKEVEFKDDFYLGVYEVTQEEWEKVTGQTPSRFSRTGAGKDAVKDIADAELKRFPVEMVSWDVAQLFLERLNKQEKETGWIYRLPKADEWEYACRGGPMSDKLDSAFYYYLDKQTNELLPEQANFKHEKSLNRTCKVGSYQPNRLGLYDLHGNVMEWCEDAEKVADGISCRVVRSAGWGETSGQGYTTYRLPVPPSVIEAHLGLRVARVRVGSALPSDQAPLTIEQRKALEWVLAIGGKLHLQAAGKDHHLKTGDAIPDGLLTIITIDLGALKAVDDDTVENLKALPTLSRGSLSLRYTHVSDAGLAKLASYPSLSRITGLNLERTPITDDAFVHIAKFSKLEGIYLAGTEVSAKGLAHLKGLKWNDVTLMNCPKIKDDAMDVVADFKTLKKLDLTQATITDAGLARVATLPELNWLMLNGGPRITDAGLEHLAKCKALRRVEMHGCKVTEAGLKKLAAARPDLRIEWNDRVIEPTVAADPDRRAAEWVLSIGGVIKIKENGQGRWTGARGDLPRGAFELAVVRLPGNPKVSDAGLANFKDCKNLTDLDLNRTAVSDAGLAHFKDCKNLTILELHATRLSDAGLVHFKDCKNLSILGLNQTALTNAGLAHFKDCKNLTVLDVSGTQVSDAGLAHFSHCKNLTGLTLSSTQLTDAGLAHFKDCKNLMGLMLSHTAVTDAGLTHFEDCKNLMVLNLANTKVSDAGLVHFKPCKNLTYLNLADTKVSDVGLVQFKDCQNLTDIHLNGTQLTDVGLAYFKDCKHLWALTLFGTQVSDTGLAHFKNNKNLAILRLNGTQVSDAGLADLAGCTKLVELSVKSTKVTEASVKKLAAALPKCKIEWDGGVIEPIAVTDPDRRAAEWVLSIGGEVRLHGVNREIQALADLPPEPFELAAIMLRKNKQVTDAGLAACSGCKKLTHLDLVETKITDTGVAHFAGNKNLVVLNLAHTSVSDEGLAHFQGNTDLTELWLGVMPKVTDRGMVYFKDCKKLTRLWLGGNYLTDKGVAHFKGCKNLLDLSVMNTSVTDQGLSHFQDCKNLKFLWLHGTKLTDTGLAYFNECHDLTEVYLDKTNFSNSWLTHLRNSKNLNTLSLTKTSASDGGLPLLKEFKNLKFLYLQETEITAAGIDGLKKSLPECWIEWNNGVIDPAATKDP